MRIVAAATAVGRIDVGKTSHHACVVDASGKLVWTQKVTNQQRVIEQLIERAHGTAEDVPLGGRFDQPSRSGRFTERTHV
jgi:hypothetical protein